MPSQQQKRRWSCKHQRRHDLQEVRRLLRENDNDWAHVVELLVEKDPIIDDEAEVGAELQAVPSSPA